MWKDVQIFSEPTVNFERYFLLFSLFTRMRFLEVVARCCKQFCCHVCSVVIMDNSRGVVSYNQTENYSVISATGESSGYAFTFLVFLHFIRWNNLISLQWGLKILQSSCQKTYCSNKREIRTASSLCVSHRYLFDRIKCYNNGRFQLSYCLVRFFCNTNGWLLLVVCGFVFSNGLQSICEFDWLMGVNVSLSYIGHRICALLIMMLLAYFFIYVLE